MTARCWRSRRAEPSCSPCPSRPTASTSAHSRSRWPQAWSRRFAHIIPNFHNPAGCTLSQDKRDRLLELASEYEFTIFEDDPYRDVRFEGEDLPTMLSRDTDDRVVYASSFSKTIAPGVRVGYLIGPEDLMARDHQAGRQHLHLAQHARAGDRRRVLPLGRDRRVDRHA